MGQAVAVDTLPKKPRDSGGRFAKAGAAPVPRSRVPVEVAREHARRMRHGMKVLAEEDPGYARALNRRANEIVGAMGSDHRLYVELVAEARDYVRGEAMLAAVDAFILGLQDRVIDKKRKRLHTIMHDRRALAEQLGTQRERIARLKSAVELEARIAALEGKHEV
jgi:hypothetical protein